MELKILQKISHVNVWQKVERKCVVEEFFLTKCLEYNGDIFIRIFLNASQGSVRFFRFFYNFQYRWRTNTTMMATSTKKMNQTKLVIKFMMVSTFASVRPAVS